MVERREAPVSFRPGKLVGALRSRTRGSWTEGQVAKRDLGRYYLLLGRALLDDRLTRAEASWLAGAAFEADVADTLSGDPSIPEHRDPSDELLRLVRLATRRKETDVAHRVTSKVEAMTSLERAALLDALDRLPMETEEQVHDPGNWALIGVHLAEEPARRTTSGTGEPSAAT